MTEKPGQPYQFALEQGQNVVDYGVAAKGLLTWPSDDARSDMRWAIERALMHNAGFGGPIEDVSAVAQILYALVRGAA